MGELMMCSIILVCSTKMYFAHLMFGVRSYPALIQVIPENPKAQFSGISSLVKIVPRLYRCKLRRFLSVFRAGQVKNSKNPLYQCENSYTQAPRLATFHEMIKFC